MDLSPRGIANWNERTAEKWGKRWPWYARARQYTKDGLAERDAKLDGYAQAAGYTSNAHKRGVKRAMRAGLRFCVTCGSNVRPQPPLGFIRVVTLTLVSPGNYECPKCRGTTFREPLLPK